MKAVITILLFGLTIFLVTLYEEELGEYLTGPRVNTPRIRSAGCLENLQQERETVWKQDRCTWLDWKVVMKPCLEDMSWIPMNERNRVTRTHAAQSVIKGLNQHGTTGEYTSFIIETGTRSGERKTFGGDFWRAYIRGPMNMEITVTDLMDGTYSAGFTPLLPGNYTVKLLLAFSTCDGLRDPPRDWFIKGNVQGKFHKEGSLGEVDDYLSETMDDFQVVIASGKTTTAGDTSASRCFHECPLIWYPLGYWPKRAIGGSWRSYNDTKDTKGVLRRRKGDGTLWLIGDSLTYRFYLSLSSQLICRQLFRGCVSTYAWNYKITSAMGHDHYDWDSKDFNRSKHLDMYDEALGDKRMRNNNSVLIINYGLHATCGLPFATYKNVIADIVDLVKQYRKRYGHDSPTIIWKTTTSSQREHMQNKLHPSERFVTDQRVRLFNAYANAEMCKNNIGILDVFPMSSSYPQGTQDSMHYDNQVFKQAEIGLQRYLQRRESMQE